MEEHRLATVAWQDGVKEGRDYWHLVLWAETDQGLKNLWGISSAAHREGMYYKPRMDWDLLERYSEGVMCSTACLRGPLSRVLLAGNDELARQRLGRLQGIFDDRLHVEIHTNRLPDQVELNKRLVEMADTYSLPLVAVSDSHYPTKEHQHCHQVWLAVQTNSDLADDNDLFAGGQDYHLCSEDEARAALSYLPAKAVDEAIRNTGMVAKRCDATIRKRPAVPVFSKKATPELSIRRDVERVVEIALSNWHKTLGKKYDQEIYYSRFEREMKLLISKEFCGYFLMVSDYCRWARANGILVGPGRGSGGGCLVAYLLNIIEIDPVESELIFERFLTEGRKGLPDFDIDFPASKREALTNYVIETYGEDCVVRVGTHIAIKNKGTIKALSKALGSSEEHAYGDIDAICKIIDEAEADSAGLGKGWDDIWTAFPDEYERYSRMYPQLFELAGQFVGRLKSYGRHAAGVIISPTDTLVGEVPLRYGDEGHAIAEWSMDALEDIGLVKFDLLTIRTLDTLQEAVDLNEKLTGERIDLYSWTDEYHDPAVWAEISAGRTLGMFQVETPSGVSMCKRQKPTNMAELADVITLVRPGPMRSGLTDTYIRRRFGEEKVSFPHPLLEQTLAGTYGTILYQEDVMNVCMVLAGYNENQADEVRKILGKKKVEEAKAAGEKFVLACDERGIERRVSEPLWAQMEEFAKYSFNRAHAFGYAIVAYWCAWLKVNRPLAFLTALLSTVDANRIPDIIEEARVRGFTPQPPDINVSGRSFTAVDERTVRYGITDIKDVGDAAFEAIAPHRPFVSFDDYLERKGSKANSGHTTKLIRIGAFDSIEPNRKALMQRWEWRQRVDTENLCRWRDTGVIGPNGLPCTRDWSDVPVAFKRDGVTPLKNQKGPPKTCTRGCWKYEPIEAAEAPSDQYTAKEIRDIEMEIFGVYLSSTPFDDVPREVIEACATGNYLEMLPEGGETVGCFRVEKFSERLDKNQNKMAFFDLATHDGYKIRAVCFQRKWAELRKTFAVSQLEPNSLRLMVVRKNDRGWQVSAIAPV
jgi:DNA polymerase-3 subunit alpha